MLNKGIADDVVKAVMSLCEGQSRELWFILSGHSSVMLKSECSKERYFQLSIYRLIVPLLLSEILHDMVLRSYMLTM